MAIPDGKPATDFSAMNREWVRAVAAEAAEGGGGGGGIPAPENPSDGDVLTYSSADDKWVAAAPSAGGSIFVINASVIPDDPNENFIMDKTWKEIADAMAAGSVCYVLSVLSTETPVNIIGILVTNVASDGAGSYSVADSNGTTYAASGENSYPETEFE